MPTTIGFDALEVRSEPPLKINPDGTINIHAVITVADPKIILDAIDSERGGYNAIVDWLEKNGD